MPLTIDCPSCAKRYQVADAVHGKRVRCQQCGGTFTAASASTPSPPQPLHSTPPLDPLAGYDLGALPALPASQFPAAANPLGAPELPRQGWTPASAASAGISNPSGGPTDVQMRLVCGGMVLAGIVLAVVSWAMQAATGTVYLAVIMLVPLSLVLGIAGLISPNVVRSVGKYGGHLPWHFKAIGYGVLVLAILLMIILMLGLFNAGFQPDRPGQRAAGSGSGRPGLTPAQTKTVLDRIGQSYAASPDANLVRMVSFPVFSINGPNPVGVAESVLSGVPGYVANSFQLSADQKTVAFQFKGDKETAIQYALLLPGPTGIFMAFEPVFKE
jgi:predicted Zn finger-like uncharacterized protein